MRLRILPTATAVRFARQRLLAENGVLLGYGPVSLAALSRAFLDLDGAPPALGRAALMELARRAAAETPLAPVAAKSGLTGALVRVFDRLSAAGPDPDRTAARIKSLNRPGLTRLAEVFADFRRLLGEMGALDPQALAWRAVKAVERAERPPALLVGVEEIEVAHIEDFSPPQLALLNALAERGWRVTIRLPFQPGEAGHGANQAAFYAVESLERPSDNLELIPTEIADASSGKIKSLIQVLCQTGQNKVDIGDRLVRLVAPGLYPEIEAVGRRVRALIDQGVKPDSIGLIARDLAGLTGQMIEDVGRRFATPLDFRRGRPLNETGPAAVLLAGLDLAVDRPDKADLLRLAESVYFDRPPGFGPGGLGRVIREAGLLPGRSRSWSAQLTNHAKRLEGEAAETALAAVAALERLTGLFEPFGRPLTPAEGLDRLKQIASELVLAEEPLWLALRDRSAAEAFLAALEETGRDLSRAGLLNQRLDPAGFRSLVRAALVDRNVSFSRREPGGVRVLRLEDVRGLSFEHLFLVDLCEGDWPRAPAPDPFLSDDDKFRLNKALGGNLFRTTRRHYRRERLLFLTALAAARGGVCLSRHAWDAEGKPKLPSPLWSWLEGVLDEDGAPEKEAGAADPPDWPDVLSESELIDRLSLELLSGQVRPSETTLAAAEALAERPGWPERLASIEDRARMERRRELYLLDPDRQAAGRRLGPYVGRLADGKAAASAAESLIRSGRLRLSIRDLESYAACPFKFMAERVWRTEIDREHPPTPDALDNGVLIHDILHRLMKKVMKNNRLDDAAAALDEVTAQAVGRWLARGFRGHPALVERAVEEARWIVAGFLDWEAESWLAGWRPWRLEHELTELEIDLGDGARVEIRCRADRIDRRADEALVIDYKTGGRDKYAYSRQVKEAAERFFQLPVYLAALEREDPARTLKAAFLVLREAALSKELCWDAELAERFEARVRQIAAGIRAGRFDLEPVDPKDCVDLCGRLSQCRYRLPLAQTGEGGGEP